MPTISFLAANAEAVESGRKRITIRLQYVNPGARLVLYMGQWTKGGCRKLMETVCRKCVPIMISERGVFIWGAGLSERGVEHLARQNGFRSAEEFRAFFRDGYGFPFIGYIISWFTKRHRVRR